MKKRNDATLVKDAKGIMRIFPYIMKRRSDSLIYHCLSLDISNTIKFVRKFNHENDLPRKLKIFDVFIATLAKVVVLRPKLNRFIANSETWQRNEISFMFVVKESLSDDAPESVAIVKATADSTLRDIYESTQKAISEAQNSSKDLELDNIINRYLNLPKFLIRFAVAFFTWLDKHGRLPKAIQKNDGMHETAGLANLGSIGLLNVPFHHLYEWGTTSLFFTIGSIYKGVLPNRTKEIIDILEVGVTLDERIADGFYIIKSLNLFQKILKNPELLLQPFDTPVE